MLLTEQAEDAFEEIDIEKPLKGLCFWVHTVFNESHRQVRARMKEDTDRIEPDSFATHPEAMDAADEYAAAIQKQFRGAHVHKIDPEEMEDEFHIFILDKTQIPIAKIAVVAEDYRQATVH